MWSILKPTTDPQFHYVRKLRKCLQCGKKFASEHRGERICWKCKASGVWKTGHADSP